MDDLIAKAKILNEALPYFRRFYGKTVVVKLGGSAMGEEGIDRATAEDIVLMQTVGMHLVVVHGGGRAVNAFLERLGKPAEFHEGLRVSDAETTAVVEMVLGGSVNAAIVAGIQQAGGQACGLTGKDGHVLNTRKYVSETAPDTDYGFVGEIVSVKTALIRSLVDGGFIPVIAPIGLGEDGTTFNINADAVAGAVAGALKAEKLVLLTDTPGILRDRDDASSLCSHLTRAEVAELVKANTINTGMLPKVDACRRGLAAGVAKTHIIDGRVQQALLLVTFTHTGVGTDIVP